jgi:hypothetical protein
VDAVLEPVAVRTGTGVGEIKQIVDRHLRSYINGGQLPPGTSVGPHLDAPYGVVLFSTIIGVQFAYSILVETAEIMIIAAA